MWITLKPKCIHEQGFDKIVEITHHFGNEVTVVTNFETKTTTQLHGGIVVHEHDMIADTTNYLNYLNNLDNEINPKIKTEENGNETDRD
jgi:hypothetical protein